MSLPAYLFLYDKNGVQLKGSCTLLNREGAIEIMSTQHGVSQPADPHTGMLSGSRMHRALAMTKTVDKLSPYLFALVCSGEKLSKAILRFYEINAAGIESEIYNLTLERVVVSEMNFNHAYVPGAIASTMLEVVSLRYAAINWNYLHGNISTGDSWMR